MSEELTKGCSCQDWKGNWPMEEAVFSISYFVLHTYLTVDFNI